MVEKIRVSLWDIFSFFLTGLLATFVLAAMFVAYGDVTLKELFDAISTFPASVTLVGAPLAFTLFGMVIEPFSNYFDSYISRFNLGWISRPKKKHSEEEAVLREEIRFAYMGSLNGKIENPFSICKEYVETKQLSTTFMVYLSRYGFYRNCAFISVASGICSFFFASTWCSATLGLLCGLLVAAVFKRRAGDFYSLMAPAVYRAFLIDKISWVPGAGSDNSQKLKDPPDAT
ncbi:hypothetical protein [Stenotrophomonas indicatrix]|uniref:hypothetical protein n=1 Tax=Stenotrophomonas indicatrix TaxID=2045451 RepID=UPI000B44BFB1|nr:hypothetical protein [Stenotrophomonas indicatrix]PII11501.1 hypothetical protein CR918_07100 [Stenotrophomonas indicatrix]